MFKLIYYLVFVVLLLSSAQVANADWEQVGDLPYTLASSQAFIDNQSLYVVGGGGVLNYPNTLIGKFIQGTITNWEQTPAPSLFWHTIVGSQQKYLIGGYNFQTGAYSNKVYKTTPGENSVAYEEMPSLPEAIALTDASISSSHIFVLGGSNNSGLKSFIYSALINPDGSLGNWQLAGNIPSSTAGHQITVFNDNVFLIGGSTNGGISKKVYRGKIYANGQIANWEEQTDLPLGITRFGLVKINNNVFLFGGASDIGYTEKIYSSKYENGSLNFQELASASLPTGNCCSPIIEDENNIYQVGGHDGSYYSTIWKLKKSELINEDLDVPLLKQGDPLWKDLIYDSANIWSPNNKGIGTWGCTVTSAAMVMNYYGINKINVNTPLDPGTLNAWLQSQPDGYTPNGLVNWMAISRLSKNIASLNPSFQFDALEYEKRSVWSKSDVITDLDNNIPDILEEPGHFVVAKGAADTTININDPFHPRETLLDGYNNTFISVRRLIPSNTNLSYIMITGKNDLTLDLKSSRLSVGDAFTQEPLANPLSPAQKSGESVKMLLLKQPTTQIYRLLISANKTTVNDSLIYLYDKNGNHKILKISGLLSAGKADEYLINFSQESNTNVVLEKKVTFATLLDDIQKARELKLVSPTVALTLSTSAKLAQAASAFKQPRTVKNILKQMLLFIKQVKPLIKEPAYSTLNEDVNALLKDL